MKTLRFLLLSLVAGLGMMGAKAQIGYQISLLNTATGEPRANETVTVTVSLSNNASEVFYSETKQATTNDFGVLSLSIGNADTFKDVDLNKMPFFIEVTANGVMIGKTQMLSVPVAEVAKRLAPLDKNLIVGTWRNSDDSYIRFNSDGTGSRSSSNFIYEIQGQTIYIFYEGRTWGYIVYSYKRNCLYADWTGAPFWKN